MRSVHPTIHTDDCNPIAHMEPLEPRQLLASTVEALVPAGAAWRYVDNGSNQGTAWRQAAFDDAGWKSGAAQLGYGDGDEATPIGYAGGSSTKSITSYFRRAFDVADASAYSALSLRLMRDDGAVVYLNGQEVGRSNMPGGTVSYTTAASEAIGGSDESRYYTFALDPALLAAGRNTVAVEVHQAEPTSSDVSFDLALDATREQTPPSDDGSFSIVVMPDTQFYSESYPAIFTSQTQWIRDNAAAQNIVFVTHVGDVVENATSAIEWQRADTAMDELDGVVPYSVAVGNHDYEVANDRSKPAKFVQHFGSARYAGQDWYGGASAGQVNHYQIFDAGAWRFLHITVQWEATDADLAWAQGVVDAHPGLPVMMTTHTYLQADGTRATSASAGGNSGEAMWQEFVKRNPGVFMTNSGHFTGEARLTSKNDAGQDVHQLLVDFQGRTNGGNGYLRVMKFIPSANRIDVTTYSPYLDQYEIDVNSQFSLPLDFNARLGEPAAPTPPPMATRMPTREPMRPDDGVFSDTPIEPVWAA